MNLCFLLAELNPVKEIAAIKLFSVTIAGKEIIFTNHMLMIAISSILLLSFIPFSLRGNQILRKGFGNFIEGVCVYIREEMVKPFLKDKTDKYICYIWTLFFFIITTNLLGLVPLEKFFTIIAGHSIHCGGAATANIWVTGALAVISALVVHISGIRTQGLWHYIRDFAPPAPLFIKPFIYFIEVMSSLIKPFALAVRLFANVFAGHVLLSVILGFILIFKSFAVVGPSLLFAVMMSFLELFVSCLQAYIFTFLTVVFISFAIAPEH